MHTAQRLRQHAALLVALAAVIAIVSALVVGLGLAGAGVRDASARLELQVRPGVDAALDVRLDLAADAGGQDAAVRAAVADTFRSPERALPLSVFRFTTAEAMVPFTTGDGREVRTIVAARDDLAEHAAVVSGSWPAGPGEAAMQAQAAAALGLHPGDTLTHDRVTLTVSGTWQPDRASDPLWFADPLATTGGDSLRTGPLVVAEEVMPGLDPSVVAHWTIVPDPTLIRADELAAVPSQWRSLDDAIEARLGREAVSSFDGSGRLAATALAVGAGMTGLRAVEPVALIVIVLVGLVALVELLRLQAAVRGPEWRLLWSRGVEGRRLVLSAALESALVGLAAAVVGSAAGVTAVVAGDGGEALASASPLPWLVPLVAAGVVAATAAVTATGAVRPLDVPPAPGAPQLARSGAIAVAVLIVLAAAIASWQLLLYGSPITAARDGGTQVDPVGVAAPSLLLLATGVAGVALLPLLRRPVEVAARRSRGATGPLAARTLVRRLQVTLTPLLLCALAAGQLVVAAGYDATWTSAYTQTRDLRAGAAVRVLGTLTPEVLSAAESTPGVSGLAEVRTSEVLFGPENATIIGVGADAIASLAPTAGIDRAALAAALSAPVAGPVLPEGAATVELATTGGGDATVTLVLCDAWGRVARVELQPTGPNGHGAPLPSGHGAWILAAIEVAYGQATEAAPPLAITQLRADGRDVPLGAGWDSVTVTPVPLPLGDPGSAAEPPTAPRDPEHPVVRLLPPANEDAGRPGGIRVAISQALADLTGMTVGDDASLALDPRLQARPARVGAIVPIVPGATSDLAVLVDARLMVEAGLRAYGDPAAPDQAWLATDGDPGLTAALRAALPGTATPQLGIDDPREAVLSSAVRSLWLGAAGAAALALVALGAVAGAQLRGRDGEVHVLRSLGVTAARQARMRMAEFALVLGVGLLVGAAGGLLVAALLVPPIAGVAVPAAAAALPVSFALHPVRLWLALAALVVALAALTLGYGLTVRRTAARRERSGVRA